MTAGATTAAPLARYREQPTEDDGRFGNTYFRWTLLHTLIVITLCSMPIWMHYWVPQYVAYVNAGGMALFTLMWLAIASNAALNMYKMTRDPLQVEQSRNADECGRRFRHIVVVPCYIDPIEVLFDCLGSLLSQGHPERLVVVVAFEKKTPDVQQKIDTVKKSFDGRFGELLITVHTIQWATEIPGGCSNKNFALRTAHQHVSSTDPQYQETSYTITTCDTDTLFSPRYFEVLEEAYNDENPVNSVPVKYCVWQGPLFYNWNLDQRPFFNRITGIMRSLMMLGGLISFNLNPMSVFSYPLELGLEAGFINPRYSVDDIIFLVRVMCSSRQGVPVKLLQVPVISGPTIGTTWWEEVDEWARQIRRWIIGSSESFHYFLTHYRGRPFFAGMRWFMMFFMYYAVLLCCGGLFTAAAAIPLPGTIWPRPELQYAGLAALALQYLVFAVAFVIDRCAVKHMTVKENVSCFRNLIHWLVAPLVLLVYSVIAFYAVVKFAFRGKKDAGHVMAAKTGFEAVTAVRHQGASAAPITTNENAEVQSFHEQCEQEGRQNPLDRRCAGLMTNTFSHRMSSSFHGVKGSTPLSFDLSPRSLTFHVQASSGTASTVSSFRTTGEQHEDDVLCRLPDNFYFGSTAFPSLASDASQASLPRQTFIYGL
eukprot:TRINITY_DN19179_c0_g1_i1.p1 TRINITY_DN19179_c0_g1~~TRINITY_DN19179_c0_g1_i1.p1  ORF type:complete len:652 (-),score=86.92 TRINITY_DN19179_c0_g1_i1:595-2550(-)